MAQNELALQFYSSGFFAPQNADSALACLDMMDFDRKDFVMQKIQMNGTLLQKLVRTQQVALQLAQTLDAEHGTALAQSMAAQFGMEAQAMPGQPLPSGGVNQLEALGGENEGPESNITKNARQRVAQSTAPR